VPLTYYQWSDEIPELNGVVQRPHVVIPALAVDAGVAIGASTGVAAAASKRRLKKREAA
jgi:hypothetical protein